MEFLYSKGDPRHRSRPPTGGVMVDRLPQQLSIPTHVCGAVLYVLAASSGASGAARARPSARSRWDRTSRAWLDRGVRFRPQIVLAAPAPFHTLWEAERVARRSGAALALMPCLHADPQVDHLSLLRLLRRADAVLTMTDYEGRYSPSLGVASRSGCTAWEAASIPPRPPLPALLDPRARYGAALPRMRPSCSSPAVRARARASRP